MTVESWVAIARVIASAFIFADEAPKTKTAEPCPAVLKPMIAG